MVVRVALVDDDHIYHFAIERLLKRIKPEVELSWFRDGIEALEYVQGHLNSGTALPDVMIVDINMPLMDGWQLVESLEGMGPSLLENMQVFMMSSSADTRDTSRAKLLPLVRAYVEKPMTVDKLEAMLRLR